jgi:hypothetical protein
MRWYYIYFRAADRPGDPFTHSHNESMGIKAKSKEDAIKKFYKEIPIGYRSSYEITEIEEGKLAESIMKLTKEDIQKYGTEEEKNILKINTLQRYRMTHSDYGPDVNMDEDDDGPWVRYEDVIKLFKNK